MYRWITVLSCLLGLAWIGGAEAAGCRLEAGASGWLDPEGGVCRAGAARGDALDYEVRRAGDGVELVVAGRNLSRPPGWRVSRGDCASRGGRVRCDGPAAATGRYGAVTVQAVFAGEAVTLGAHGGAYAAARRDSAVALEASRSRITAGEAVTLVARMDPKGATGEVRFATLRGPIGRAPLSNGVARLRWRPQTGAATVHAIYDGDGTHAPTVSPSVTVEAVREVDLVASAAPEMALALERDLARSVRTRRRHAAWLREQGRARLRGGDTAVTATDPRMIDQELNSGRRLTTFDGRYAHRADRGGYRRYVYADLDYEEARGQGPEVSLNTAMVFEKRLPGDTLGGIYLGAEMGRSQVRRDGLDGRIETLGVNAGTYGMRKLGDDVVVEAFAEVARLWQDLAVRTEDLRLAGRQPGTSLHLGTAISGVHDLEGLTLTPELTLDHAVTWSEGMELASGSYRLSGLDFRTTRISAAPRLRHSLSRWGGRAVTLSPRTICERATGLEDRSGCGLALGLGYEADFADGRGALETDIGLEHLNGRERQRMSFNVAFEF